LKRPKIVLWLLVTLALALVLTMAVPVYAANVALTKGVTPTTPDVYNVTDTIHYVMSIINMNSPTGGNESIVVEAVWDVLPDGSTVYPTGPALPYTVAAGQNQSYTYDWVATRTGTVVNTFYASGYQISTGNDTFDMSVQKSSVVIGQEVGGTASLVNKLGLVAPWAVLLGCAGIAALAVLRKRRQA
jgi:hypothetical protein